MGKGMKQLANEDVGYCKGQSTNIIPKYFRAYFKY